MQLRQAVLTDLPQLAAIRSIDPVSEKRWFDRISAYFNGTHNPQQALAPRIILVAEDDDQIIAFIAGHLTRRHGCDGELQWVDTVSDHRGKGIATALFRLLTGWFVQNQAKKVCVNCAPDNLAAINFYKKMGRYH